MEYTLSIIKPDAVKRNIIGAINHLIEKSGLEIVGSKMCKLSIDEAAKFYEVHKSRPFFQELVDTMTSGPILVQVLKGENAVLKYRNVMGATNPKDADEGTIRKLFALSIGENSVHGSDSLENAEQEISFFFAKTDLVK